MEVLIKGEINSLAGIGSKIQVDGWEEAIVVVSSERSTRGKQSKYKSGSKDTSKAAVLDDTSVVSVMIVGRIPQIFSLIETVSSVKKKHMKSSPLRVKGMHGSTEPDYSAEKKLGIVLNLFYQWWI